MSSLTVKLIMGTIAFFMLIAIVSILRPRPSSAPAPPPGNSLLMMLIAAFIGTVVLAFGLVFGAISWNQVSGALRTEGVVVSLKSGSRRRPTVPVVRYEVAGQSYQSVGSVSFGHDHYWVGELVQVAYRPDHPEEGAISSFTELWAIPVGCAMAALFPYSVCFAMWRARRRWLKLPPAVFDPSQQS